MLQMQYEDGVECKYGKQKARIVPTSSSAHPKSVLPLINLVKQGGGLGYWAIALGTDAS